MLHQKAMLQKRADDEGRSGTQRRTKWSSDFYAGSYPPPLEKRRWWMRYWLWEPDLETLASPRLRPTEDAAFLNLFWEAYAFEKKATSLTARQHEAMRLFVFAKQEGMPQPQAYVADQMGITQQAASRLLQRVSKIGHPKRLYFGELRPYMVENNELLFDENEERERKIRRTKRRLKRFCAAHGQDGCQGYTPDSRKALCWPCFEHFSADQGTWPSWLVFSARDIERQLRLEAIAILDEGDLLQDEN